MIETTGLLSVSGTEFVCNLHRIIECRGDKNRTLRDFCAHERLAPVWSENFIEQAAINAMLIVICRPDLDAGKLNLGALDVCPDRMVNEMNHGMRSLLQCILGRRAVLSEALGIRSNYYGDISDEVLAAVPGKVASLGISRDDFRGVAETAYLLRVRNGHFLGAQKLATFFAPEAGHGNAWFRPADIARDVLKHDFEQCCIHALQMIREHGFLKDGIAECRALVAAGWMAGMALDERIIERLEADLNCSWDNDDLTELAPYRSRMNPALPGIIVRRQIDSAMRRLNEGSENPEESVAILREQRAPETQIQAAIKAGYLYNLTWYGDGDKANAYKALLAGTLPTDEAKEALFVYTDRLAANPSWAAEWVQKARANREYFRPGAFETAVLTAGYFARYGYWSDEAKVTILRDQFPLLAWDTMDSLSPPCVCGIDLRSELLKTMTSATERAVVKLLCDFLGTSKEAKSIGTFCEFVHQAISQSIGLPRETLVGYVASFLDFCDKAEVALGHTTVEAQRTRNNAEDYKNEKRAALAMAAFGGVGIKEVKQVPYLSLLRMRSLVADLVRKHAKAEIA